MADLNAVQEILKISTFLYKAQIASPAEEDEVHDFVSDPFIEDSPLEAEQYQSSQSAGLGNY